MAKELIGAANADALTKLSAREQVFMILSMLGYDDDVNSALTKFSLTLSPSATHLIDDCRSYIGFLTGEALTAYNDTRTKYFPDCTPTLEITSNGATRLERYSFSFTDGAWLYTSLSIG